MRFFGSVVLALITVTTTTAQVFYGVTRNGGTGGGGTIFKTDVSVPYKTTVSHLAIDENPGSGFDYCRMVQAPSGKLYGVMPAGGTSDSGVLFEFDPSNDTYIVKYSFDDENVGTQPFGALCFGPNDHLYGTTTNGGANWDGTIFEYDIALNQLTKRADFNEPVTGGVTFSGMVLADDNMFYGAAFLGGANGVGTIYQFDPSTNTLTKKQDFTGTDHGSLPLRTPVLYDGKLYGAAIAGGANSMGVIYEYDPSFDTFTNIYDFAGGTDGAGPNSTMTVVGSLLYGTTTGGGVNGNGTIYEFDPSLGTVSFVASFTEATTGTGDVNIMTLATDGYLYGTTEHGGANDMGTLFQFDPAGPSLTTMFTFDGTSGSTPKSGLTLASNGKLYGSTAQGGTGGSGLIFSYDYGIDFMSTRVELNLSSAGAYPEAGATKYYDGKLYGMTTKGGSFSGGVLYEFNPAINAYNVAYEFGDVGDGANPAGQLLLHPNGLMYGLTSNGGASNMGTLFSFNPSNSSYTKLRDFDGSNLGARPKGGLTLASDGTIFGMTSAGGTFDQGVIFSYDPGLDAFNRRYDFDGTIGTAPYGEMVEYNGTFYGLTKYGGNFNDGVLFEYVVGSSFDVYVHFNNVDAAFGGEPGGSLVLGNDLIFYGVTSTGGSFDAGTLFSYNPSNRAFQKKADFDMGLTGGKPTCTLVKGFGDRLYGFAPYGGIGGWGSIFEYNTSLQTLEKKLDFSPATGSSPRNGSLLLVPDPPAITSFSPYSGLPTSTVTITGSNFSPSTTDNIVFFGPVKATVATATPTQLEVVVPYGVEYGPITVTVAGLTAESKTPFTPGSFSTSWIPSSFTAPANLSAGSDPKRSVMADLDRDEQPDAIVAGSSGSIVHVYRNISTIGIPNFDVPADFVTTGSPYTVDAADIDGDGRLDVLAACGAGYVSILRNQSSGPGSISFASSVNVPFGNSCVSLTTADIDGDGKLDVIAVGGNASVAVMKNNSVPGQIIFAPSYAYSVGAIDGNSQLWDVAAADVDGDQKIDIIVPIPDNPSSSSTVAILRNISTPGLIDVTTFAPNINLPAPGYSSGVDVGDLDFDGLPELVIGSSNEVSTLRIFKNFSSIGFLNFSAAIPMPNPYAVWDPKIADVDGDTRMDIMAGLTAQGRVVVFRNEWLGGTFDASQFSKSVVQTGGSPLSMHIVDLDKDLRPDLVVANEGLFQLQWFPNMNGIPPPVVTSVTPGVGLVGSSVVISGSNFSSTNNTVSFGATQVTNVTSPSSTSITVAVPAGATFAPVSVTADGGTGSSEGPFFPDFATATTFSSSSFAAKSDFSTGTSPLILSVGDLNADGLSEVVVANIGNATISVLKNSSTSGSLSFSDQGFGTPFAPVMTAVGDIDGDHRQDFVSSSNDAVLVFHHTNTSGTILPTTFTRVDLSMAASTDGIALSDIDRDGKPDIVASSAAGNLIFVIRNQTSPGVVGSSDFEQAQVLATPYSPTFVAVDDLDGDGRPEILVGYSASASTFSIFQNFNDKGEIFASEFNRIDFNAVTRPHGVALADVDGDDKTDILVADFDGANVGVLRNVTIGPGVISTASFATVVNYATGANPSSVAGADIDGDNHPDILTANATDGTVSVLRNNISAPGPLTATSFDSKIDFTVGPNPRSVAVADVDNDGTPDIVASSTDNNTVAILLNQNKLGVPVLGSASNVLAQGFDVSWGTVTNATGYRIDVSTDGFVTMFPGYDNLQTAGTSLTITGLTPGLTYSVRVRAENLTGSSENSNVQVVTLVPEAPVISASSITQTSFVANWTSPPGATDYYLDVSTDHFATWLTNYEGRTVTASGNMEVVTGLSAGTEYQFRVYVSNLAGFSPFPIEVTVLLIPPDPVATAATAIGQNSFTANWTSSLNADGYLLDVSVDDFNTFETGYENLPVSGTSQVVTGLLPGGTYKYRVRSLNGSGTSGYSNDITVSTASDGPVATAATNLASNSFTANWDAVGGATGYQLDVSEDNFVSNLPSYDNLPVAGTSQTVAGLTGATNYQYRVRATTVSVPTGNSNIISVLTTPLPPSVKPAGGIAEKSFTALWTASVGATEYQLDVSNDGFANMAPGYDNAFVDGSATSFLVDNLISGDTYEYRLRAVNASGPSANSTAEAVTLVPGAPNASPSAQVTQTTFTAEWAPALGAQSYLLDVSNDNFVGVLPDYNQLFVSSNTQEVIGLTAGTEYQFRVKAVNDNGQSGYSNEVTVVTRPPDPVATPATSITATSFVANWNSATMATEYRIDVSADNFTTLVTGYDDLLVASTSVSVTGLTPGTTYKYRVRSANASGASGNSADVTVLLIPPAPGVSEATLTDDTSFTANWIPVNGASEFRLDVSSDNFTTALTGYDDLHVTLTAQSVTGLDAGQTYKYRVRAVNTSGTSVNSNEVSVITIPPPPDVTAATLIEQTSFTANWDAADGADNYFIDVSKDSFTSNVPGYNNLQVTGLSVNVTGLDPGGIYEYVVRAANASGSSVNSFPEIAKLKPANPLAQPALGIGPTYFTANWNAADGAQIYRLDVSSDDFANMVPGYDDLIVNDVAQDVVGLTEGVPYKYRVRAENPSGLSGNSNIIAVTLGLAAPVATDATNVTQTSFTANWGTSVGAMEYRVDVSDNNFVSNLPGYDDATVTGTSLIVSGLTTGSSYRYRVRAKNVSSTSINSNEIVATVLPGTPIATAPTGATLTSFTANWNSATGAANYRVDVSDDNFVTILSAHDNEFASGTSLLISNLTSNVTYKYRVRAENAGGASPNSNEVSALTSPLPTIDTFEPGGGPIGTTVTVNGFNFVYPLTITFNGAASVEVSSGTATSFTVNVPTGTTTGTFSVEVEGLTDESTDSFLVDATAPLITKPANGLVTAGDYEVVVTITDAESQASINGKVHYRSVAGAAAYDELDLVRDVLTTTYKATIPSADITESGVEYYITADSYGGSGTMTGPNVIVQINVSDASGLVIPYNAFGDGIRNYRIISIPLDLTTKTVSSVFVDDLGAYSRKNWRVSHWNNGATAEYTEQSNLAVGEGYWLIVKDNVAAIDTGPGKTVSVTQAAPFTITLKPGWNQIGNPYNFNLYWADVANANSGETFSSTVKTYGGSGFSNGGILNRMEGAFVKNTGTSDIDLEIPTKKNPLAGGRIEKIEQPIDGENWIVDLRVTQGEYVNAISGFGMNKESKEGIDRFDDYTLPRFFDNWIELNHTRKSDDDAIAIDVVPTAKSYVWEFDIESNFDGEMMSLEWDNAHFGNNGKTLILWDEQLQLGTDMRKASRYEFNRLQSRRFKVFFGDSEEIADKAVATRLVFHSVSPNPTDGDVKVAFSVPKAGKVTFDVYDLLGRKVWSDSGSYEKGYHEVDLTGRFTSGLGMVIMQLGMGSDLQQKRLQIR